MSWQPEGLGAVIFNERYSQDGESWDEACKRVAKHVAKAEILKNKYTDEFYGELVENRFCPGGRIWYGAGRPKAQLLNCFVLPTSDSREGWGQTVSDVVVVSGTGGGIGINCCMSPDTLILTQDFRWVRLDSLQVGDPIIGLDEEYVKNSRHLRPATVTATEPVRLPSYEIATVKGTMIVSDVHPVLARRIRPSYKKKGQGFQWVYARDLTADHEIAYACDPWEATECGGYAWLGGVLDGEGCLSAPKATTDRHYNSVLSVGQNPGVVFNRIGAVLDQAGVKYTVHRNKNSQCKQYRCSTKWDSMKALALFPTWRLWQKRESVWNGAKLRGKLSNAVKVESIRFVGERDLIALETSTKTFIGDGFFQHNSPIRPRGYDIKGTGGKATGAVSLMQLINKVGDVIVGGGSRRSALMLCLDIDHPDIEEFLNVKLDLNQLTLANISVVINSDVSAFQESVRKGSNTPLSFSGRSDDRTINNRDLWERLVENAWKSGEPGILNGHLANQQSNIWYHKPLVSTNPCGEIWLEEYGCCCLGALVLPRFVRNGSMDWDALAKSVYLGVRFLDDVLTVNHYPLPAIEQNCLEVRRIGLGVMGLHSMLLELGYRYSSSSGREFVEELFSFIMHTSYRASIDLAKEYGPFPAYDERFLQSGFARQLDLDLREGIDSYGIRNCAILTIAPTGTTSMVSGVSSGIEPLFAPVYYRNYRQIDEQAQEHKARELVITPEFEKYGDLAEGAYDLSPADHFEIQRIVQGHIDNAVSKTINLPNDFTMEGLGDIWLHYLPHIKGSTIYRSGSRGNEPLEPVPHEEVRLAIAAENARRDSNWEELNSMDCPNGVCSIDKSH